MKRWHHEVIGFSLLFGFPAIVWHVLKWLVLLLCGQPQLAEWSMGLAWIAWGAGFITGFCVLDALKQHLRRLENRD